MPDTPSAGPLTPEESEALINWALDVFYEARPFVSEQLGDMLRAIEAAAVNRHRLETGCEAVGEVESTLPSTAVPA